MNLTDEEIRIKVAEARGLRFVPAGRIKLPNAHEIWPDHWEDTRGQRKRIDGSIAGIRVTLPNYPLDLNACAEFEATLTEVEQYQYWAHLVNLCNEEARKQNNFKLVGTFYQITATARQRCLAYLKTKGIIP